MYDIFKKKKLWRERGRTLENLFLFFKFRSFFIWTRKFDHSFLHNCYFGIIVLTITR